MMNRPASGDLRQRYAYFRVAATVLCCASEIGCVEQIAAPATPGLEEASCPVATSDHEGSLTEPPSIVAPLAPLMTTTEWVSGGLDVLSFGAHALSDVGCDPTGRLWLGSGDLPCSHFDSTAALQAALNSAAAARLTLFGAPGTYRTSAPLRLPSFTRIVGNGMRLQPIASIDSHVLLAEGESDDSRVEDIDISDLHMDGTNRPLDADPPVGRITYFGDFYFKWARRVSVKNVSFYRTHDGVSLSQTTDFTIEGVAVQDSTAAAVNLFSGSRRGIVTNVVGRHVSELFDFFNDEDVAVSDFDGVGYGDGEGFDLSTSRRITISRGSLRHFGVGVLVKTDAGLSGMPSWQDIYIYDVKIADSVRAGLYAVGYHPGYDAWERLRVVNVEIDSTAANSTGVDVRPALSGSARDAYFANLFVDVPGVAFRTFGVDGVTVRGSALRSRDSSGFQSVNVRPIRELAITDSLIVALSSDPAVAAVDVSSVDGVTFARNGVVSRGGAAIRVSDSKAPMLGQNIVYSSGWHGLSLSWSLDDRLDPNSLGRVVSNTVYDWGLTAPFKSAYSISINSGSTSPRGLIVADNAAILTGSAEAHSQIGFRLLMDDATASNALVACNYVGERVPTPYARGSPQ